MRATVSITSHVPFDSPADELLAESAERPGFRHGWVLRPLGSPGATVVTMSSGDVEGDYRVYHEDAGMACDEVPSFAQLVWFDGPRSPALREAMERASRERIAPALEGTPGHVTTYRLRGVDDAELILTLTTSVEALEEGQRRIMSTELLPGEDLALLPGPDRVELCRVLAQVHADQPVGGSR